MKKNIIVIGLCVLFFTGCTRFQNNTKENEVHNISGDVLTQNEDSTGSDVSDKIAEFLMDAYEFESESAVKGAAERLYDAGCNIIISSQLIDASDDVYTIELIDINDKTFLFTIDHQGYIGPIQDKEGNYLYTPID